MPELRLNLISKEWVIIATEQRKRPEDFRFRGIRKVLPSFDKTCPFCPGNEQRTPDEIFRISDSRQSSETADGWKIRVVPNRFPALRRDIERVRVNERFRYSISGFGLHDVIVETPRHDMPVAMLPVEHVSEVIRVYKRRFIEMYKEPGIGHVIIFKNHGEGAGTSLAHPHTQIVGTPVTPFRIRRRLEEATRFFDFTGECLICKIMAGEKEDGERIVLETEHFITFIPYAAMSEFHMWIFPKRHASTFSTIKEEEIQDFALNLKTVLAKLYFGLNNPDFNYVIRSNRPQDFESEHIHWYLSIMPRLSIPAGFEVGSGISINTVLPEDSAKFLRSLKTP